MSPPSVLHSALYVRAFVPRALLQQQGVAKINAADALPATSADVPSEEEAKRDLARVSPAASILALSVSQKGGG